MKKTPASIEDSANASAKQTRADSANAAEIIFHSKPTEKQTNKEKTMNKREQMQRDFQTAALASLGFTYEEIYSLRRINSTLQRWAELECGDSNDFQSWAIERDEETEKPFMVIHPHTSNTTRRYAVADREKGALKRWAAIMAKHPNLWHYHQTDPRGCAVHVGEYNERTPRGADLSACYTNGIAVW